MMLQQLKQNPMVGTITSPDRRNEIAKEFKRTHFKLGGQGMYYFLYYAVN